MSDNGVLSQANPQTSRHLQSTASYKEPPRQRLTLGSMLTKRNENVEGKDSSEEIANIELSSGKPGSNGQEKICSYAHKPRWTSI